MSRAPRRPRVRAGLGLTLLFSMAALLLGTGLDFATAAGPRFWIDEQPGGLAVLGAATALAVVLVAHVVRLLVGRRVASEAGERNADA